MPLMMRYAISVATALAMGAALAQNFPTRPIRIVTPPPGGSNDVAARIIAHELSAKFGQQVIIDNRPAGVIPGTIVAKAVPDGYTLLLYGNAFWLLPFLRSDVQYDPVKHFAPITSVAAAPNIVVVTPALPVASVKELIAYAKAKPKALNYASSASGSASHLAAELFKQMAGVDIVRINYSSSGTTLNDLIAGQVQLMFAASGFVAPNVKLGRLRALAVTSATPSAVAPGLPTVAASGLPGYESGSVYGIFAPAGTPAAIVQRINLEVRQILERPDLHEKFLGIGLEATGSTPQQFSTLMRAEMTRMGKLIQDLNIREQ